MVDPDLVIRKCIERIDDDEYMCGKPDARAIGQYCAVFRINSEYLVTTVVDVVPGTTGVTLGSDWLNNNVSSWNLTSGKVTTYDGSFHTKMERDVRMVRTSGKKGSPKKKEPDQVLCGTPIYAARQRRVAPKLGNNRYPSYRWRLLNYQRLKNISSIRLSRGVWIIH